MKNLPIAPLVAEYQCPGCTNGSSDTMEECGAFESTGYSNSGRCGNHSAGTFITRVGRVMLGFPRGFNRPGPLIGPQHNPVRFFSKVGGKVNDPGYNKFNTAVWAMEYQGNLLVRCFSPRLGLSYVDVIEGGTIDLVPSAANAANVGEFFDDID